jgi:hypothetical protein
MQRTESCVQMLHERIVSLEERQQSDQSPSDEQVERVLRKILAERFGGPSTGRSERSEDTKPNSYFAGCTGELGIVKPLVIDPAMLVVDPAAVPSKAYSDTFNMLESRLAEFPNYDVKKVKSQIKTPPPG